MANITYLIGAGASAECLPLVSDMNRRMDFFLAVLEANETSPLRFTNKSQEDLMKNDNLKDCLRWVIKEEKEHYSIDTFARKLSLREERENYNKLKAAMICYFLFEQKKKIRLNFLKQIEYEKKTEANDIYWKVAKDLDKRYDAFFASILKNNKGNNPDNDSRFPLQFVIANNIKVISWNYDSQFELSLNGITEMGMFNILEKQVLHSPTIQESPNNPSLIKLNGSTVSLNMKLHLEKNENKDLVGFIENGKLKDNDLHYFSKLYTELIKEPLDYFNFAWETVFNKEKDARVLKAKEIMEQTDCLVVIGYSFPYYNMEIDKDILSSIKDGATVYIQDMPEKFETILDRILYFLPFSRSRELKQVKQTDLFFLPPEYFGGAGAGTKFSVGSIGPGL